MKCYVSDSARTMAEMDIPFRAKEAGEFQQIKYYPSETFQEIIGFGGALTEAAAYTFSKMSIQDQERLLDLYFGKTGNGYTLCRTHIQSCDFALGNYAYVTDPMDRELRTFSLDRDRRYIIPLIKAIQQRSPSVSFLASPWSPPGFMKTNGEMNHGGKLLNEYRQMWADMIVKYLLEYAKEGIMIDRVTVQNEPLAVQKWDSCIVSGAEEAAFTRDFLRPALRAAGLGDVKIEVWDHNKDVILERIQETFGVQGAAEAVDGIAFHWYTGDHFEALQRVRELYPQMELIFTEGCVEYSRFGKATPLDKAERYAHSMIGDLKAGANGVIDWNICLDEEGGPNHAGNFCDAPVMYDIHHGTMTANLSYWYIGHISRFVRPGARRILVSSFTSDLECCGFMNPDGSVAIVILNRTGRDIVYDLSSGDGTASVTQAAHSIMTFVVK